MYLIYKFEMESLQCYLLDNIVMYYQLQDYYQFLTVRRVFLNVVSFLMAMLTVVTILYGDR